MKPGVVHIAEQLSHRRKLVRLSQAAQRRRSSSLHPHRRSGASQTPLHAQETSQASSTQGPPAFFTYEIQPNDTLKDLCMSAVGRYDDAVLAEIRKLNPELRDPNRLVVGQEIRFPLNSRK